jgi:hypothetical protein
MKLAFMKELSPTKGLQRKLAPSDLVSASSRDFGFFPLSSLGPELTSLVGSFVSPIKI